MLHYYAFKNFQSFRERTVVSMELNQKAPLHGWQVTSRAGHRLSTILAVMGANGAGKTAALKPLAFAEWFISQSFNAPPESPIPLVSHLLGGTEPTEIELEAEDDEGVVWRYELIANERQVLREALYRKRERFNYVFIRILDTVTGRYAIKQQGFDFNPAEARKVRANASLIATAAQYGVELAQKIRRLNLASNVTVTGRAHFATPQITYSAEQFGKDELLRAQMAKLLSSWDLGLSNVLVKDFERDQADGTKLKTWLAIGQHKAASGEFSLLMEQESSGTQSAFVLLSRILPVLRYGGLALIDELDSDLHPLMIEPILELFANPITNPTQAQLLFTCHTPEVLDLLQKSQVLFVEKVDCASRGYRADEIKGLRSDDSLRAKYLAGALGGVPQL